MDKVSVIVPTYNRFHYLLNTIRSIKEQTYKNIEIIIVNDCSTQKEYYEYDWKDVKIIHLDINSKQLLGYNSPGYVRNRGCPVANSKYVAFCDDDDIWFPTKIEKQLIEMKNTNCKLSCTEALIGNGIYNSTTNYSRYLSQYSKNWICHLYNKIGIDLQSGLPNIWDLKFMQTNNCVICSSVVIEKDTLTKINCFQDTKPPGEDYACWLRALHHTNCVYLNEPLVYYDAGHGDGQNYSK